MEHIINHIIIIINLVAISAGFAAFFVYLHMYLINRLVLLKNYLELQVCMVVWSIVVFVLPYTLENLKESIKLLIYLEIGIFLLTAFFFYYSALFYHELTGASLQGIKKTIFKSISVFCALAGTAPFLIKINPHDILTFLITGHYYLVMTLCFSINLISIYLMISRFKKIHNGIIRTIIKVNLLLFLVIVPLLITLVYLNDHNDKWKNSDSLLITFSTYVFLWHVLSIILFMLYVRKSAHLAASTPGHTFFRDISGAAERLSQSLENYNIDANEMNQDSGRFRHRYGLTVRQYQIIELMIDGLTNQEMSDKLGVSKRTIETHIQSIYNKLSVNNRIELFRIAAEFNLIKTGNNISG
jgi:DNA-binding CsgD family transcriptional regulator